MKEFLLRLINKYKEKPTKPSDPCHICHEKQAVWVHESYCYNEMRCCDGCKNLLDDLEFKP